MAYIPDPTDATQPLDGIGAGTAAAEFRALKGYLQGLVFGAVAPFTNRIINGKFAIDQRNAGAAINIATAAVNYVMDRWYGFGTPAAGVFSMKRDPDALYPGDFRLKIVATTADAALAAGDLYYFGQRIEGTMVPDLAAGSVNARQITVAFEVESTILGTFPIAFKNSAANRTYIGTFTVNTINTREYKTVTLTLDTAGAWLQDTGIGLTVAVGLGVGATFQAAAANAWGAGDFFGLAASTNFMATINNTMYFKDFRLYRGAADIGVDQRLFAQEISLCERYYEKTFSLDVAPVQNLGSMSFGVILTTYASATTFGVNGLWVFRTRKRAGATIVTYNPAAANANWRDTGNTATIVATVLNAADNRVSITGAGADGFVYQIHATASAEL